MQMPVEVKSIDKELGTLEAIFSTQDVDRHGDIVLQDGWDLSMFKKNPVILNSHNYGDAADVIGKASNVKVEGKKLQGKITFAVNENPKAKVIFDLYAGGFLNAFSVGFIPKKFKENKDGSTDWYTIEESELLEVSAVSVPANARALAKAKGIDTDVLGNEQDHENDDEGEDDEIPQGDEVQTADGEPTPDDGDGGEGEPDEDDAAGDEDAGDSGDEEIVPEKDKEADEIEPEEPKEASYARKVADALVRLESREKRQLRKAADIINGLLNGDEDGMRIDRKTKEQIRKRKVNQAIRVLMQTK